MSLNKSALLKGLNRVALFLVTGALLVTGVTPAQANVTTPLFLNFETADVLKTVSSTPSTGPYGGATTEIKASANLSGDSLHFTKSTGSQVWAGVNLLLGNSTPFRYTDASKPIITLDYWSNDTVASPVMMKVEGAGAALKTLEAKPGLNKLSFDMSTGTGWNPDAVYKIIAFFPNFGADDRTYTGAGPVANTGQVYEIDNVSINGGTAGNLYVPAPAGRDVPATLVTFEANDALGAKIVGDSSAAKPEGSFAGAATTIEDAPAGGNGGKALKIVKAGEVYAGATILNITGNSRITNGTHKTVTFNYFSAKANSPLRVELVPFPRALGKTVTVPAGWSRVVVDFTDVAGWSATEDYVSLAIFPDFNEAIGATPQSYFVDDIAINGAVTPAIRSTPQVLVNFETNDTSGFALTDFGGNASSVVTDAPADGSVGSTKALKLSFAGGDPWAGTTFLSRAAGVSLISAGNFTVKANIYSPVEGKRINLKLENVATPSQAIEKEATSTSVVGWKTYSFDFTIGGSLGIDYNRATIFVDYLGSPKSTTPFYVDDIAFNGAKGADLGGAVVEPPVVITPFTGNANVRLVGMDDTNSFNRPSDAAFFSVANPWYRVGINVRTKQVPVGSTQALTYLVTNAADNTPLVGQTVTFTMGKEFSGSTAKVNVGSAVSVGTQNRTVTGVTGADGRVTFNMVNTDVAADAADFPGANLGVDFKGKKLFTQVSAWVTSQTQDSIDLVDFVFFRPESYSAPREATSTLITFEAGDTRGASVVGGAAGAKIEGSFEGSATTIEDAPAGGNGGKALKIVKSGQPWAGANVLSFASASRITNATHKTVTFNYYSPKANSPLRVEIGPGALGKTVTAAQGWSRVVIDFSDVAGWSANTEYTVLAIFPDFLVAPGAEPASFFVDNIGVNGAATPVIRTAPSTLVNFESNDTSGYSLVDFGGNTSSVVTDAPANGSAGSKSALKIVTAGEPWAGTTFLTKGAGVSLISAGNLVVKANIYSPVAGKRIMLKVENSAAPSQNVEKDADSTSVVGWKTYTFDFTTGGNLGIDYDRASIFVDFGAGKGSAPWYVDDVAFNGANSTGIVEPAVIYNARLADWNASNSFDGTKIWGDAGLAQGWFDVHTGYFAKYVAAGSTFELRYRVTNATTGANAPDGTVVTLSMGAAWSGSNAKFSAGNTVVDGATKWGANGQMDMATVTAVVANGFATVTLKSEDTVADATVNPGNSRANPDSLSPRFMQVKISVAGNSITRQDWVNIIATKPSAAPTVTSVSARNAKAGQAVDIVGTNLGDALGHSVALLSPATAKLSEVLTPVTILSVNAERTRMTVLSPESTQKGTFLVTNTGGSAGSAAFASSATVTSKPTISMPASLVREVGSTITLTGNNLASVSSVTIGEVAAPFSIVSATSIVVTVPAGVVSGSKINATNAGGTTTTSKFIYQAAVIETVTTAAKVGETVTISGKALKARSVVFAGNKAAKPEINENGTVTVVVPVGALSGVIKITTSAGIYFTKVFTVTPPAPTVSSFSPVIGKSGSTVVTVRGTSLKGATVTVGTTAVTLLAGANSTSLKFVIPADSVGGKITVTTPGGSVESASALAIK